MHKNAIQVSKKYIVEFVILFVKLNKMTDKL